jgi:hypothetical protein
MKKAGDEEAIMSIRTKKQRTSAVTRVRRTNWLDAMTDSPLICAIAVIFSTLGYLSLKQFADPDLWGRFSAAALWNGSGRFPYTDVLSFTATGRPWTDHEWLSGSLFFEVMHGLGEPALLLLKDLVLAACVALIFGMHRRVYTHCSWIKLVGFLALSPVIERGFVATVRCQIFSFLFTVIWLAWLERVRLTPRRTPELLALVPLGVLWANLHGGFVVGMLLVAAYGAVAVWQGHRKGHAIRAALPYVGILAATLLGVAYANPYGPRYLTYLVHAWTLDRSDIVEWTPIWRPFAGRWMAVALVSGVFGLVVRRLVRNRRDARPALDGPTLTLVLLLIMAIRALRFEIFLALGALALIPVLLDLKREGPADRPRVWPEIRRLTQGLLALSLMIGIVAFSRPESHPFSSPILPVLYPTRAVNYLSSHGARGKLLAPFSTGEFVGWALYPNLRVAIDGRFEEVYTLDETRKWTHFFDTPIAYNDAEPGRWLRDQGVDWVIVHAQQQGAIRSLEKSGLWTRILYDRQFFLYGLASASSPEANPGTSPITRSHTGTPTLADYFDEAALVRFRAR